MTRTRPLSLRLAATVTRRSVASRVYWDSLPVRRVRDSHDNRRPGSGQAGPARVCSPASTQLQTCGGRPASLRVSGAPAPTGACPAGGPGQAAAARTRNHDPTWQSPTQHKAPVSDAALMLFCTRRPDFRIAGGHHHHDIVSGDSDPSLKSLPEIGISYFFLVVEHI